MALRSTRGSNIRGPSPGGASLTRSVAAEDVILHGLWRLSKPVWTPG